MVSTLANELIDEDGRYKAKVNGNNSAMQLIKFTDKYQIEGANRHLIKHLQFQQDISALENLFNTWEIADKSRVRIMMLKIEKDLKTVRNHIDFSDTAECNALNRIRSMNAYISSYEFKPEDILKPIKSLDEVKQKQASVS